MENAISLLDKRQILERLEYLQDADAPECIACAMPCPIEAAFDDRWYIDAIQIGNGDLELDILCPRCLGEQEESAKLPNRIF